MATATRKPAVDLDAAAARDVESSSSPPAAAASSVAAAAGGDAPTPTLTGDWHNFMLLLALYTLQGIPIGLASSVPLFLQSRGASFSDQATFGLSSWPYSLKLLWAPIVDALYTTRLGLGQRKSWIVPIQLVAGVIMVVLGGTLNTAFGGPPEGGVDASAPPPRIDVAGLTAAFFLLYLLVATQDIAVDGWALTLLRPENVGYASTANTVGQSAGIMMAYGLLMALDSPGFCNRWVRAPLGWPAVEGAGLVTFASFVAFWGYVFMASTVALWALKTEAPPTVPPSAAAAADAAGHVSAVSGSAVGEGGGGGALVAMAVTSAAAESSAEGSSGRKRSGSTGSRGRAAAAASPSAGSAGSGRSSVRRRTPRTSTERNAGSGSSEGSSGGAAASPAPTGDGAAAFSRAGGGGGGRASSVTADELEPLAAGSSSGSGVAGTARGAATSAAPPAAVWASVAAAYADLWRVIKLPAVLGLVLVMATAKAGFTATDSATSLVMQSRGLSKETIAFFDVVSTPLQLVFPLAISRLVAGPAPMSLFLRAYPLRIVAGLAYLALIYGALAEPPGPAPSTGTLAAVFLLSNGHSLVLTAMFLAQISFFTQVSDPSMGGSYMTLLNTVANLGNMWPRYFVLNAIEALTERQCVPLDVAAGNATAATPPAESLVGLPCKSAADKAGCAAAGGVCVTVNDGYRTMVLLSSVAATAWWLLMRRRIKALEAAPRSAWLPAPAATA